MWYPSTYDRYIPKQQFYIALTKDARITIHFSYYSTIRYQKHSLCTNKFYPLSIIIYLERNLPFYAWQYQNPRFILFHIFGELRG